MIKLFRFFLILLLLVNPLLADERFGKIPSNLMMSGGEAVRRNAADTAFEAFTPGSGGGSLTDGDKGDITVSGSGATWTVDSSAITTAKINNDAVTYAKIQNISATDKILGRSTAGAGDVEEIACTSAGRNLIDDTSVSAQRTTLGLGTLATQSGTFSGTSSGTNTGDNAVNTLYSSLVTNATHTGEVTGATALTIASSAVTTAKVNNDAITYAKIQNVSATDKILGRSTAGAGDVEEIACTSFGRALLDDTSVSAQRTTLGLGTLATQSGTFSGTSSGTNTGDNAVNSLYSSLVTNATHTGEVTGSGALTVNKTAISNQTYVDPADFDRVLIGDASDSDNLKKTFVHKIADTASSVLISSKSNKTPLAGTEDVLILDGVALKKTTAQDIADLASASGVSDGDKGDITVSSSGTVWTVDSSAITNSKIANSTIDLTAKVTGILPVANAGTNITSYAQGDILYSSATNVLAKLTKNTAATRYLANTGTSNNPAWNQIDLSNGVTGVLPEVNGGRGLSTPQSGTYTPTLTSVANLDAKTAYTCQYMRVGSVVTVSGRFDADATAIAITRLGISLPIASNFTAVEQCGGTSSPLSSASVNGPIYADIAGDYAHVYWTAGGTSNLGYHFSFTYQIL